MAQLIFFAAWPRLARAFAVLAMVSLFSGLSEPLSAADGADPVGKAQADLLAAEKQFEQTSQEFGAQGGNPATGNSSQRNGQTSWSEASSGKVPVPDTRQAPDPRVQALQGSPESGYAGTWTDPATGDIITSVIAPTPPPNQNAQSYPIIVEPNVGGSDWGSYDYGYSGGYGSDYGGWTQWPSYSPGGGYGPGFGPSPYPGGPPPGLNPPPPPPSGPGPGMMHPPLGQFPGPAHPGYRPLRPNPPMGMMPPPGMSTPPGMTPPPGMMPPPGMNPPPPPPGGGWQPGHIPPPPPGNPGGIWRPGMNGPMGPPPGNWGHFHGAPPPPPGGFGPMGPGFHRVPHGPRGFVPGPRPPRGGF